MKQLFTNNAQTTLNGSISNGGTSLNVVSGSSFPSIGGSTGDWFLVTLFHLDGSNNMVNTEVVKVTAQPTSTNWTISRDFESTVAAQGGPGSGGWAYPVSPYSTTYCQLLWTAAGAGNMLQQGRGTIWIPAAAMTSRTTNGPSGGTVETTTNKVMIRSIDFDAATQEYAQFAIAMPKSWDRSTVTAQFVWSHAATTTNFGVAFGLQGVAVSDDDPLDVAFGTGQVATDTGGTTNDCYLSTETSAITIAGSPASLDTVLFQVYREVANGADTMAIDARLMGVRLYYGIAAANDA